MTEQENHNFNETQKVEARRINMPETAGPGFWQRIYVAIFPLLGGLILDFTDFISFGPIGLFFGFILGTTIGYFISRIYGFSARSTLIWSLLAGIYCTTPGTELFPIATIISATSRFNHPPKAS